MSKKIDDDLHYEAFGAVRERRVKSPAEALSSLMALCSKSEKSSGDAVRLMYRWGVDESEHDAILKKLIDTKFIDDNRFAEAYVRDRMDFSGWGAHKIQRSLTAKGVAREIINRVISELEGDEQRDRLWNMLTKKRKSLAKEEDKYKLKGKLFRYGISIGYEYEDVLSAVEKIINIED